MPTLFRDIETRSVLDLKTVGAWRYAADPTTEVLCVAYAVDDNPVQIWAPGDPIPNEFTEAAHDPTWTVVAHNDQFETAVEHLLLHSRFGWPLRQSSAIDALWLRRSPMRCPPAWIKPPSRSACRCVKMKTAAG